MHVDLSRVVTTSVMKLHQVTNDVLAQSFSQQKSENLRLKKRVKDLEDALNMGPLLMTTLEIQKKKTIGVAHHIDFLNLLISLMW